MPNQANTLDHYVMGSPPGPHVIIDNQKFLYFGGTGYLGLHAHPEVVRAACDATRALGVHSASSRVRAGTVEPVLSVERKAADFFSTDTAYYFVTGYLSVWIMLQTLQHDFDVFLLDSGCHYSIVDAVRMIGKPVLTFSSQDADHLQEILMATKNQRPLVITDGVFSASGALAPVDEYLQVLSAWKGAGVLLDDAHGFGTIGHEGRGLLNHLGLRADLVNSETPSETTGVKIYCCGTLSKALGGFGGIIPGSFSFIEKIKLGTNFFRAASAPPSSVAAASAKALELLIGNPSLYTNLQVKSRYARHALAGLGFDIPDSPAPIIRISDSPGLDLQRTHIALKRAGIFVPYADSYSGENQAGFLRVSIFANHTRKMIDEMALALQKYL